MSTLRSLGLRPLVVAALMAAFGVLLAGCGRDDGKLRVGVENFTEQAILTRIIEQLVEARTDLDVEVVDCGDAYTCGQALRSARIDMLVEYTGTGLAYYGAAPRPPLGDLAAVRRLYSDLGIEWLNALGFDNGYRVIMPTDRALALDVESIEDLGRFDGGLRFAVSSDYVTRPGDGLATLLRRHGIRERGKTLLIDRPSQRLRALLQREADVAVIRATDGALRDVGVRALADTLDFFPTYQAAIVAREGVLARDSDLRPVLALLAGAISTDDMQAMNFAAAVEGRAPEVVAHRFLSEGGFVLDAQAPWGRKPELVLAIDSRDRLSGLETRATSAVTDVFDGHSVLVSGSSVPVQALVSGRARLAVVGADRFFADADGGISDRRDNRIEAVAVVGARLVHVVRRKNGGPASALAGKVGVPMAGSSAARVGASILAGAGKRAARFAAPEALLSAVEVGDLDAAILVATPGDPLIAERLAEGALTLMPLPDFGPVLPVFLRAARIPAETYRGQAAPIDSLVMQVVIASATPEPARGLLPVGPASALGAARRGVSLETARQLAEALGEAEFPDPALPAVWARSTEGAGYLDRRLSASASVADSILNLAMMVFLGWALWLLITPRRHR